MSRSLQFRGPEDGLIDCWTSGNLCSGVRAVVAAAEHRAKVAGPPTARVADLSVAADAADYVRWVDAEHGLEGSGMIVASDYALVLSA